MLTLLKVNKIVSATFFTDWQVLYFVQINIDYDDGAVQHKEISAWFFYWKLDECISVLTLISFKSQSVKFLLKKTSSLGIKNRWDTHVLIQDMKV